MICTGKLRLPMAAGAARAARSSRIGRLALIVAVCTAVPAALADGPNGSDDATAFLARLQDAYVSLAERVGPSVVTIRATRSPNGAMGSGVVAGRPAVSSGSGFVLRADGLILTSQHVIADAMSIDVFLDDGRRFRARRVAADARSDLAVIRIQATGLAAVTLGDADRLRRGHIVLALGNSDGISDDGRAAVCSGLVSGVGRPLPNRFGREEDRYYGDMIQFAAPIGPGSSGGPLLDIRGRVVGVVNVKGAVAGGTGYAIPITARTRRIIERLSAGQSIEYGYLGADVIDPVGGGFGAAGRAESTGVTIIEVEPDGPADRAGLFDGDIVVTLAGQPIRAAQVFVRLAGEQEVGTVVPIEFVRDGQRHRAQVTVGRRPASRPAATSSGRFDFRGAAVGNLDPAVRRAANLPRYALLVLGVTDSTPAARAGLAPGDIIVRADGAFLTSATAAWLQATGDKDILLGLASGGSVLVPAR